MPPDPAPDDPAVPADAADDFDLRYRALAARDARFDGQFFTIVHSTGIYCRPSCPARTPRRENVDFVPTAAAAVARSFRACRRCLPDASPGSPRWNTGADLAGRAMRLIADGLVDRAGVEGLASALGYTPRHLNRVLAAELGAGPLALARAHRTTTARILLTGTSLPISDVAFAAGFASIRQFNDTLRATFSMTPTELRTRYSGGSAPTGPLTLRLPFRPPYDVDGTLRRLAAHAIPGLEACDGTVFRRTLALPHGPALVGLTLHDDHASARFEHLDLRDLTVAVNRLRRLADLDADPYAVDSALSADPRLAPLIEAVPGIRLPGSVDAHETLIRTMAGQQISVAAARTRLGALVAALGEPAPWHDPDRPELPGLLFPTPARTASDGEAAFRGPRRLARAVAGASAAIAAGETAPHPGSAASELRTELLALAGVGPWTADQVVLRVTGDPDVLPHGDLVIGRAAADLGIDLSRTQSWRPWRSYAAVHLLRHATPSTDHTTTGSFE
ncbi:MAG: Ada metal-binding domain-containing protein [Gordonia sp. (in: high G+C Gram-positive bacteria)]|uniref:AlkA N-terminal domain-containing protein n=1 Tax=Gordonia sp. (in: high G+C Gram-positive bacteria) TaxID=84139 RepID=UPI0039E69F83